MELEPKENTVSLKEEEKIPLIVVAGPTASGKTALAASLAQRFHGEVVSADSMQIYKGLPVGTAQPSLEEMGGDSSSSDRVSLSVGNIQCCPICGGRRSLHTGYTPPGPYSRSGGGDRPLYFFSNPQHPLCRRRLFCVFFAAKACGQSGAGGMGIFAA